MPVNRPNSRELLESVREMLESQLLPTLEDSNLTYQCRVSINSLKIIERELAQSGPMLAAERERLAALLGEEGKEGTVETLNARLVERIRRGDFDSDDAALLAHLRSTALDRIAIDNPRYSTYRDYLDSGKLSHY